MNFSVSPCRMMTSEMVKTYVNSADRFLSACVSLPQEKLPSVSIFTLFSHLLHVSLLTVTIPCWKGCEYHQLLSAHPLKLTFCDWKKRSPKTGILICASILLHPGTPQCKQRQFGPFQMSPEASVWPFTSKEKLTKKIQSKRRANFSSNHQKKHSMPRVQ